MSNIVTLDDLEDDGPMPNPWSGNAGGSRTVEASEIGHNYGGSRMSLQVGYINMNGEVKTTPPGSSGGKICMYLCCPCFVDPCGEERRGEYKKCIISFSAMLAIIQLLALILCICIGGFASPSENPSLGPPGKTLNMLGAKNAYLVYHGHVYRLFTPMLLHAGVIHLAVNMFAQLRFGLFLERKWGTPFLAVVYIVSGIGGSLWSCLIKPEVIGVGASGALMGLMGGFLAEVILTWNKTPKYERNLNLVQALVWIVIAMALGASKYIDWAAHLGGCITGLLVGVLLFTKEIELPRGYAVVTTVSALVLVGMQFVIGLVCFWLLKIGENPVNVS